MTFRERSFFPSQPSDFVLRDAEGQEVMRFSFGKKTIEQPEKPGLVAGAFKRGVANTQSDFASTAALIAEMTGSDEYQQAFQAKANEYADRAQQFQPVIGKIENIQTVGDYATYAVEVLAENAPMLLSMAIPGGAVAKTAQLLGRSKKAAGLYGATAAYLADVGLQTGESATIAREAGTSAATPQVVGHGLGKAALDFVPLLTIAKRLGLAKSVPLGETIEKYLVQSLAQGGYLRRAAGHSAAIVATEVPTETMQEYMNISLDRALRGHQGRFTPDEISQLKNAAAGAATFGLFGLAAGIRRQELPGSQDERVDVEETPPDSQPDQTEAAGEAAFTPRERAAETGETVFETTIEAPFPEGARPLQEALQPTTVELPPLEETTAEVLQPTAAREALAEELTHEPDFSFDVLEDGSVQSTVISEPFMRGDNLLPGEVVGPISQAIKMTQDQLAVLEQFPEYKDLDPADPDAQIMAALHPGLQNLYELRADVLEDADSYRDTDGQLTKAAENKVKFFENRIGQLEERLGILPENRMVFEPTATKMQDPAANDVAVEQAPKKEATEQEVEQNKQDAAETNAVGLTEGQMKMYQRLVEKQESFDEDLTDREMEKLVELEGILNGEIAPPQQTALTDEQAKEIEQEVKEIKEAEAREADLENKKGRKISHTRVPYRLGVEGHGLSAQEAGKWLTAFLHKIRFGPKVKVITTQHPEYKKKYARDGKARYGWFRPAEAGTVWIVADNHHHASDVMRTWLHETLAHYGLRAILTEQQFNGLMNSLVKNPPPGFPAERIAELREKGFTIQDQLEVEEYIAAYAESVLTHFDMQTGLLTQPFWQRVLATVRAALRRVFGRNMTWTDNDIHHLLRNVSKALTGQITIRNSFDDIARMWSPETLSRVVGEEAGPEMARRIANVGSVWGVKFNKMFLTPLQFAERYQLDGVMEYLDTTQKWWGFKREVTHDVTVLGEELTKLDKGTMQKVAELTMEASVWSDELGRRLSREEEQQLFKRLGVENDKAVIDYWRQIDQSFRTAVELMRKEMEIMAIRMRKGKDRDLGNMSYEQANIIRKKWHEATPEEKARIREKIGRPAGMRLAEIAVEVEPLTNRNYFPHMRFGQHIVTIRAKKDMKYKDGKNYKEGKVVHFQAFVKRSEAEAAFKELDKSHPQDQYTMQLAELNEQAFHFMGVMSPQMYENLLGAIPAPKDSSQQEMSDVMKETLKEIYFQNAPGRSFLRHLTKRAGIHGYSEDVIRVFASYHMNLANHLARLKYALDFDQHQNTIEKAAKGTIPDSRIQNNVSGYFQDHYQYIMNPENDLAQLRAFGFLWYLGFNVKSALVNLTQVPMVAYPYLASRYGDARAFGEIGTALRMVTANRVAKKEYSGQLQKDLERGIREGFIDESRATELAALGENHLLQRVMGATPTARKLMNTSYYGAYLFQQAEKINREVTFIAAWNLAKANGQNPFRAGRHAVQTAMFEYAKWNRAPFMRGKKSVFFLFWQYMQGLSYIAFGGANRGAAMRVWMMLLLAGGLQGLPFAENIMDLVDFVGSKSKKLMGLNDPRVDLRADLRELALTLTDQPDLVMHGLSRYYGLGPLHLAQILGAPVPQTDISGSISAGRIIPGTDAFGSAQRDPNAKFGRFIVDALGPVAGIGYNFWRAATDTNPDVWKKWERTLPAAIKSASKAARRNIRGAETYRGGGEMATFDPHNLEHRAENLFQMLGFATTRVNQRTEADFRSQNVKQYWALHRAMIMEDVAYAYMAGDPEGYADAIKGLHRFNDTVPDPMIRINSKQLQQSLKQRFRRASLRELGLPSERLFLQLVQSMRDLFPEASVDIGS